MKRDLFVRKKGMPAAGPIFSLRRFLAFWKGVKQATVQYFTGNCSDLYSNRSTLSLGTLLKYNYQPSPRDDETKVLAKVNTISRC